MRTIAISNHKGGVGKTATAHALGVILAEYEEYTGEDALQYVISKNLHRRHLNETQRAGVASRMANMEHGGWRGNQWQAPNLELAKISIPEAGEYGARTISRKPISEYGIGKFADTTNKPTGSRRYAECI